MEVQGTTTSAFMLVSDPFGDFKVFDNSDGKCCIPGCLYGREIEVTNAGFSNGLFGGCTNYNSTFILGPLDLQGSCCALMNDGASPGGSDFALMLAVGFSLGGTPPVRWKFHAQWSVEGTSGQNLRIDWRLFDDDAKQAAIDLCSGVLVEIPFYAHTNDTNAYSTACNAKPDEYADNTTSRRCIWNGDPLKLQIVPL